MSRGAKGSAAGAVVRRVSARGRFVLESAAVFGTGAPDPLRADTVLVRDARGRPMIPGSSVAGSAQAWLRERCYARSVIAADPRGCVVTLFGPVDREVGDGDRMMSPLVVAAAVVEGAGTSIRDHVRIDPRTGVALDRAKFDEEVLEPGAGFELRFDLVLRDTHDGAETPDGLMAQFRAMLEGFRDGEIRLGAHVSRGYGRGRVGRWSIRDLRMDRFEDVRAWLAGDDAGMAEIEDLTPLGPALCDQREFVEIEGSFSMTSSLLSRAAPSDEDFEKAQRRDLKDNGPDHVHSRYSDGRLYQAGTGVAGALRAGLLRAASLFVPDEALRRSVVEEMMGPAWAGEDGRRRSEAIWQSRLRVEESLLTNSALRAHTRIAIDRFTGSPVDGALFKVEAATPEGDAKSEAPEHLRLAVRLSNPLDYELTLLVGAWKDLATGRLPLDGETAIGRGALRLREGSITLRRGGDTRTWDVTVDPRGALAIEGREKLPMAAVFEKGFDWASAARERSAWRGAKEPEVDR